MWTSAVLARASSRALRAQSHIRLAQHVPAFRKFCDNQAPKSGDGAKPPKSKPDDTSESKKGPEPSSYGNAFKHSAFTNYERYSVKADKSGAKSTGSERQGGAGNDDEKKSASSNAEVKWYHYAGIGAAALYFIYSASTPSTEEEEGEMRAADVMDGSPMMKNVTWKQFRTALASGRVSRIEVMNGNTAYVYTDDELTPRMKFEIGSVETLEHKLERAQEDLGLEPHDYVPVKYSETAQITRMIMEWMPTVLFIGAYIFLTRRFSGPSRGAGGMGSSFRNQVGRGRMGGMGGASNIFNVGKAQVTVLNRDDNKVDISFKDVAGLDEAKEEIMEFVQYLKKPEKYKELGAKIPKGALMYGPPGTGKTLLAKATAGEAGVPFLTMSGSDFMEMFVGVGPSRVRDLFAQARSLAPCIIFLDEIDAIGRKRGRGSFVGGNDERENTLNQLLVEMDGFASNSGVVVLAGTNRSDVLDQALLRPGRFDRQISIDPPDIKGRKEIFGVHLKKVAVAEPPGKEEVAKSMAALTPGFAGADIANICNEAALIAARSKKDVVELVDFEAAVDRVVAGLEKKNLLMSPEEKRTIAYHEAGHAVAGWFLEHAMPLLKVSIIPRGSAALGYAQYQPLERYLASMKALEDQMCMTLAGRASEELFFDTVTTGAADDFNKVTRIAYQSVSEYGLGKTLKNLAFPGGGSQEEDGAFYRPYSDRMARQIDEEVREIVANAYERTKDLLNEKKDAVVAVANLLLVKEAIDRNDMVDLLGERPFGKDRSSFDEIVEDSEKETHSDADSSNTQKNS